MMNLRNDASPGGIELQKLRKTVPRSNLNRALALLFILFVAPLLGATYWIYVQAERELENAQSQQDLVRARTVAALVDRELSSAEKNLESIADRQMFRDSWAKRDLPALDRHLREALELEPSFLFAMVSDPNGTLRAITPPDPIVGQNFAYRDWYRGVTANWQPYVSEVYRTAVGQKVLVVAVAVPIRDEKGNPAGILMATYALDQLVRKFNALEAGSPGELYVVDQRGVMATAPTIDPVAEPTRAPEPEVVSLALAGKEGSGRFREDKRDNFLAYAPVSRLGWAVIFRRPTEQALAATLRLRQRTFSTGLYLLLIYLTTATLAAILVRRQGRLVDANQKLNREMEGRIAESKRAREELDRFFTLSIDMFCIVGFDGYFKRLNPAWENILGHTTGELLATPYLEFVHPEDRESTTREAEKLSAGGRTISFENRYRCKDGSYKWLLWSATPLPEQELTYAGARDITERKSAEETLKWAKEEAERVSKFKDQFLSTMSHELRTPLNAILGFSDLLPDERYGTLSDRQRRYVSHIHTSGKHLLSLINDILDLSKIEAGRLDLAFESVRVEIAFAEVRDTLRPVADKKMQTLSQHAENGLNVRADETRFKQVLMNLVGNAIKFTPDGGRIELAARMVDGKVRVEVRDNGPGIPPEEQKRIFESFYRLRQSQKSAEGTGLGLAITQRLVELHGGELGVKSQTGHGSCFHFSLPVAPAARQRSVLESGSGSGPKTTDSPRILVIEDDPATVQLLESQLISLGCEVVTCDQAQHAAELAAELQPNAITLDLFMKPANGWEVLVQLKRDPRTASIPVIVISIADLPATGAILGADEYLVKPVDKLVLSTAVERCLGPRVAGPARTILVVEDDAPTREIITELLTSQGHAVTTAADGAEARAQIGATLPELVILDLLLPKASGFELLAEWRADPRTAGLPVFVLTSKDLSRQEELYVNTHAEYLFRKQEPWKEALANQVRRVVRLGQLESA